MGIHQIITIDQEILAGQPVFTGTRVPVESLFDHLEAGVSLDEFLDDFPTVTKEQALALLEADIEGVQRLVDYLSYKEATAKSKARQSDVDKLAKQIKKGWWDKNKKRLLKSDS